MRKDGGGARERGGRGRQETPLASPLLLLLPPPPLPPPSSYLRVPAPPQRPQRQFNSPASPHMSLVPLVIAEVSERHHGGVLHVPPSRSCGREDAG